ncbi:MAG: hypothetical protein ISN64_03110 [Rickettsia sp.]|nr:hypothetical protein [Rickettsia sp.]
MKNDQNKIKIIELSEEDKKKILTAGIKIAKNSYPELAELELELSTKINKGKNIKNPEYKRKLK